jgi:non-ribosomal peptide synthetase component E (peptide arylation enzyme)
MATRDDGAAVRRPGRSDVLQAAPEAWPIPREVAGIALPDSKLARDSTAEIVVRKPETAAGNFLAGIGERHVAGYKAPNFCDLINASPFAE